MQNTWKTSYNNYKCLESQLGTAFKTHNTLGISFSIFCCAVLKTTFFYNLLWFVCFSSSNINRHIAYSLEREDNILRLKLQKTRRRINNTAQMLNAKLMPKCSNGKYIINFFLLCAFAFIYLSFEWFVFFLN